MSHPRPWKSPLHAGTVVAVWIVALTLLAYALSSRSEKVPGTTTPAGERPSPEHVPEGETVQHVVRPTALRTVAQRPESDARDD